MLATRYYLALSTFDDCDLCERSLSWLSVTVASKVGYRLANVILCRADHAAPIAHGELRTVEVLRNYLALAFEPQFGKRVENIAKCNHRGSAGFLVLLA